jgi:hypothetical protein
VLIRVKLPEVILPRVHHPEAVGGVASRTARHFPEYNSSPNRHPVCAAARTNSRYCSSIAPAASATSSVVREEVEDAVIDLTSKSPAGELLRVPEAWPQVRPASDTRPRAPHCRDGWSARAVDAIERCFVDDCVGDVPCVFVDTEDDSGLSL